MQNPNMTTHRAKEIICNFMNEISTKMDFPKEDWEPWLKTEIGMSDAEIDELKADGLFREPEEFAVLEPAE